MILVTGADGLVGRAVCRHLAHAGEAFVPVVRAIHGTTPAGALAIDLSVPNSLHEHIDGDINAIIHLAAAVPHSTKYPDIDATACLTRAIDRHVLEFARQCNCAAVYASTCGLYNRRTAETKHEDDLSAIDVRSPYFAAKYDGERAFGGDTRAVVVRLSAPVGPGLKPQLVVSRFLDAARRGDAVTIWGSGTREQDFVDVRDVARLLVTAASAPRACTMNVAAGHATTMIELAEAVVKALGKGTVCFADRPDPLEGETARYAIDRAWTLYGWQPRCALVEALQSLQ